MIALIIALTPALIALFVVLGISHFVDRYYDSKKPSFKCAHEWDEKSRKEKVSGMSGDVVGLKFLYCCKKCGVFTNQKIDNN